MDKMTPTKLRELADRVLDHEYGLASATDEVRAAADAWEALRRRLEGAEAGSDALCANYLEISMVSGPHCYNCARRDGYPWMGRPTNSCTNFAALAGEAEHEELLRFRSGASKLQDYIEALEKRLEAATDPIRMAAIIRGVDGKHELGAAELAERICAALAGKAEGPKGG